MRFSALFQHKPGRESNREGPARAQAAAPKPRPEPIPVATHLPDDLDARVRLVGEWQQLET